MSLCRPELLNAFHDGELSLQQRAAVEQHLRNCPTCSAEFRTLQQVSKLFQEHSFDDLTDDEQARLHQAIEQSVEQPILRLSIGLIVAAASVLIISCAWLMELPAPTATIARQQGVYRPEPWEQVATSLRPDPLSLIQDDPIHLADAAMADWMLTGLTGRIPP